MGEKILPRETLSHWGTGDSGRMFHSPSSRKTVLEDILNFAGVPMASSPPLLRAVICCFSSFPQDSSLSFYLFPELSNKFPRPCLRLCFVGNKFRHPPNRGVLGEGLGWPGQQTRPFQCLQRLSFTDTRGGHRPPGHTSRILALIFNCDKVLSLPTGLGPKQVKPLTISSFMHS